MSDIFSDDIPELLKTHLEHLKTSAISIDVIKERGYTTAMGTQALKQLEDNGKGFFFNKSQRRVPGILIPLWGVDEKIVGYQLRPDRPREQVKEDGKIRKIKYETPVGSGVRIDVPPRCHKDLANPEIPLLITEGVKKVDALATAGACAIGLVGVWGFKGKNIFGAVTVLADFDYIAWKGRTVYLVFDSDSETNSQVRKALDRLSEILQRKEAKIKIVHLPGGKDGEKTGADDFLSTGKTLQDIIALAQNPVKNPKRDSSFKSLYGQEDGSIVYYKSDQITGVEPVPLGNFWARITDVITKDNGIEEEKYFKIIGREQNGKPLPEVEIPVAQFEKLAWVTENWDVRAVISADRNAKSKITQAMMLSSYDAHRRHIYSHTGWRLVQDQRTFLTNGSAVGIPNISVELDDDITDYALPQPNDDKEALQHSFNFLNIGSHSVVLPVWTAMFLAPLNEIIDTCFTIFLVGTSGSFKSAITGLALNHFGHAFNYNRLPASWNFTENKLEKLLFLLKDLPLVIDDWAPGQDAGKQRELESKAERVIRAQANRQGRGRLTADTSSRRTYKPRGLLITSGEQQPGGQSHNARMFVVEIKKNDIDQKHFFEALEKKHLYSQAMSQYIQWLAGRWDELKQSLPVAVRKWREKATADDKNQHARLPNAVALMYVGLTVALQFFVDKKIVTSKDAKKLADESWNLFIESTKEQSARVEMERPAYRFLDALITLVTQGRFVFGHVSNTTPLSVEPPRIQIGWRDEDGNYLLNPSFAYNEVNKFLKTSDFPLTFKENRIWKDMKELNMTETNPGRNFYAQRIYGNFQRVVKIRKEIIETDHVLAEEKGNVQ